MAPILVVDEDQKLLGASGLLDKPIARQKLLEKVGAILAA
jgi:hypothetical protein